MHRIIADGFDLPHAVFVRGELGYEFHQEFHDFYMTSSEGSHETTDFAMVLAINISALFD